MQEYFEIDANAPALMYQYQALRKVASAMERPYEIDYKYSLSINRSHYIYIFSVASAMLYIASVCDP